MRNKGWKVVLQWVLGFIMTFSLIIVVLLTSFELATYSNFNFYEKEYNKYNVYEDLKMEPKDVLSVTHEMMDYLRGEREDLVVYTKVDGKEQEFFNDREKAHMVDVQKLFLKGLALRKAGIIICIICLAAFFLLKGGAHRLLPKVFLIGSLAFVGITVIAGILMALDFNRYFTMFHHLFFTNDLWLLDPETDLMINMLPEGFFYDMVLRIGVIFLILLFILELVSFIYTYILKKRAKKQI